jgi:hypothetical protein
MERRSTLATGFAIALVVGAAIAGALHVWLSRDVPPAIHPKVTKATTPDDLLALIDSDQSGWFSQDEALCAFADLNRPVDGETRRELRDSRGRMILVVGANGTAAHPDGYDAAYSGTCTAEMLFLVAGNGKGGGLLRRGGRGGATPEPGRENCSSLLFESGKKGAGVTNGSPDFPGNYGVICNPSGTAHVVGFGGHGGRGVRGGDAGPAGSLR